MPMHYETKEPFRPRWRKVLSLREKGLTFTEIGEYFGFSRQQAYKLYVKAVNDKAE